MNKFLLAILFILFSFNTFAGGYRVSVQGPRQLGMAHTGVAMFNSNAEVLFFNPAGISFLEKKFNISLGGGFVFATGKYQNQQYNTSFETNNPTGTPINLYATYRLDDKFTFGMAIYTPYGSGVEWPTDWAGAHLINNIKLQSIFLQPTVAYKVNSKLSVAAGAIIVLGGVKLNKNVSRSMTDEQGNYTDVTLDAKSKTVFGYSLGVAYKVTDKLNLGVSYRSKIAVKVENGDVEFNQVPAAFKKLLSGTKFNAELPLPAELTVGASYKVSEKLTLAFDYNMVFWSTYKTLVIDFTKEVLPDKELLRNYENSSVFRLGAEYDLNEKLILRTGVYYDVSPIQDGYLNPETPSLNSVGITGGLTYNINSKFAIDASFVHLSGISKTGGYVHHEEGGQTVSFTGEYKTITFIPSIGISYKL